MRKPWQSTPAEIAATLASDPTAGLSSAAAQQAQRTHGPNRLQETAGNSALQVFLGQFKNVIIWVLIGAALVAGLLGEWVDTLAIAAIVLLNTVLGFIQEFRAEKALAALRKLSQPFAKVLRDGELQQISAEEIVPGDLVELEAGDHVPADGRLVQRTANFAVQEASLTGESTAVAKHAESIPAETLAIAERRNMLFTGTAVVAGRARYLVTTTGMDTELGHIAGMIQAIEAEATPLQKRLDAFGKQIVKICFVLVLLVFALQLLHNRDRLGVALLVETFMSAVSLAVAAIPEGLPAVVTIALALGVQRMVKRHALIRKLPSVETLGCATVICSDKTGTLTRNEMTVLEILAAEACYEVSGTGYAAVGGFASGGRPVSPDAHPALLEVLRGGVLCNGAALRQEEGVWKVAGDPTEGALLTVAAKAGLWKHELEAAQPLVEELPFDSERKCMSMLRREPGGGHRLYAKGAPDVILLRCTHIAHSTGFRPITAADCEAILAANARMAGSALRVLATATRPFAPAAALPSAEALEQELTFTGLLAMMDPPRAEARTAVSLCHRAGIRTVMITGDHKNTAVAVGRDIGLADDNTLALNGDELDQLSDADLDGRVDKVTVYARVSPEHKLRIVRAWRRRGQIVAMTGDGVNDAPAVKEADIGIAMGITGTDVTKEVSDMVVTDDNFASVVAAVEEGRGIYDNIRKFVHYLLSCNAGEIMMMFLAALVGMPVPLLPVHILWINLVSDGLPALALGVDPVSKGVMDRPPRPPQAPVVSRQDLRLMLFQGAIIALLSLAAFGYGYCLQGRHSLGAFLQALVTLDGALLRALLAVPPEVREQVLAHGRTMGFFVLAASQDFHAYNCRSQTESLFRLGLFSNLKLVAATLVTLCLNLTLLHVPWVRGIMHLDPLTMTELAALFLWASGVFWAMEACKLWGRMRRRGEPVWA
jgi:Ca2+-transporting ATPase